jgi:hypothetical protein
MFPWPNRANGRFNLAIEAVAGYGQQRTKAEIRGYPARV